MGGFGGVYRFYGRVYRNFINYKIIYKYFLSRRMQRFTCSKKKEKGLTQKGGVSGLVIISTIHVLRFLEALLGGGGSVRRRNTLHVVGGRQ
jgi:hypothetical protein